MKKFTLTVNTDNESFDINPAVEVTRLLRAVAEELERWGELPDMPRVLRDANGNNVGSYTHNLSFD